VKFTLTPDQRAAASKAPEILVRHLQGAGERASQEVARAMRQRASAHDMLGTLKQSIRAVRDGEHAWTVAPGVNYARMVEEGTGPAAGRARYFPRPDALMSFVRRRSALTFTGTRPGSSARRAVAQELVDRVWALARSIHAKGTRPHPFVRPTARTMAPRVRALFEQATRSALEEIARGRAV